MRTFFGAPLHKAVGCGLVGIGLFTFAGYTGTVISDVLNGSSSNLFHKTNIALSCLELFLGHTLASENRYCADTLNFAYNALFQAINSTVFLSDRPYQKVDEFNILKDVIDGTLQPIEHYHIQPVPNMRR